MRRFLRLTFLHPDALSPSLAHTSVCLALPVCEQLELAANRPACESHKSTDALGVRDDGDALERARMGEPEQRILQCAAHCVAGESLVEHVDEAILGCRSGASSAADAAIASQSADPTSRRLRGRRRRQEAPRSSSSSCSRSPRGACTHSRRASRRLAAQASSSDRNEHSRAIPGRTASCGMSAQAPVARA